MLRHTYKVTQTLYLTLLTRLLSYYVHVTFGVIVCVLPQFTYSHYNCVHILWTQCQVSCSIPIECHQLSDYLGVICYISPLIIIQSLKCITSGLSSPYEVVNVLSNIIL